MSERGRSVAERTYWREFEARLADLPITSKYSLARQELVSLARAEVSYVPPGGRGAHDHADRLYRLRYGLGPTVTDETLEQVYDVLEREATDLLAGGVSPALLGLVGERGGVR